jgi:hypothetical protein
VNAPAKRRPRLVSVHDVPAIVDPTSPLTPRYRGPVLCDPANDRPALVTDYRALSARPVVAARPGVLRRLLVAMFERRA